MQGAELKEICQSGGRAGSWVWNWVRKGWLLSVAQEALAPVSYTGGTTQTPTGVSKDQPNPPGGSGGYCSDDTVLSQLQYYFATCPISHPPCPCSHPEKGLWQCSHVMGRQPEKPFNPGPSSPGKTGHHFCSSKMPCSLQGGKALAGDRKSGNDCTSLGFQVLLVGDRRLLLSQMQFKGSIAPESCSPRTGSVGGAYRSWVRTWDPHSVLLSKEGQHSLRSKWQRATIHPLEQLAMRVTKMLVVYLWRTHGKTSWVLATLAEEKKTKFFIFKPYLGSNQYSSVPGTDSLDIQFPILDN